MSKKIVQVPKIQKLLSALQKRALSSAQIRAQFKIEKPTAEICRLRKKGFYITGRVVTNKVNGRTVKTKRYQIVNLWED